MRIHISPLATISYILIFSSPVFCRAADGTWNTTSNGNWANASNWTSEIIAGGTDSTATFDKDITSAVSITVDSGRTVGHLVLSDSSNPYQLQGAPLTLATSSGAPSITVVGYQQIQTVLAGTQGFTKLGVGTLQLFGANTYTGVTTIERGVLRVYNNNALGASGVGNGTTISGSTGSTAGSLLFDFAGISTNDTITLSVDNSTASGFFGAYGLVTQQNSGTNSLNGGLVFERRGSYTGNVNYFLNVSGNGGAGALIITSISGNLASSSSTGANTLNFSINPGVSTRITGPVSDGTLGSGATGLGLLVDGGGDLYLLDGSSTYTRSTQIQNGRLILGADALATGTSGALGAASAGNVQVGTSSSGTSANLSVMSQGAVEIGRGLNANLVNSGSSAAASYTYGGITADVSTFSGNLTNGFSGTQNATYTLTAVAGGRVNFTGTIASTAGSGAISVNKTGAGIVSLSGANTYEGGTTVTAGTLLINNASGSGLGTGNVAVNGGTLGGGGSFTGAVTMTSGTLAPGSSIGSLASGAVTLNNGSTFAVETDSSAAPSAGADLLAVSGSFTLNGTVTLSLTNLFAGTFNDGVTFALITYSGTWNAGLFTYNAGILADDSVFSFNEQLWKIDYNSSSGGSNFTVDYLPDSHFVTITAVPEPSSLTLTMGTLCLTTLTMFFARRRRTA